MPRARWMCRPKWGLTEVEYLGEECQIWSCWKLAEIYSFFSVTCKGDGMFQIIVKSVDIKLLGLKHLRLWTCHLNSFTVHFYQNRINSLTDKRIGSFLSGSTKLFVRAWSFVWEKRRSRSRLLTEIKKRISGKLADESGIVETNKEGKKRVKKPALFPSELLARPHLSRWVSIYHRRSSKKKKNSRALLDLKNKDGGGGGGYLLQTIRGPPLKTTLKESKSQVIAAVSDITPSDSRVIENSWEKATKNCFGRVLIEAELA